MAERVPLLSCSCHTALKGAVTATKGIADDITQIRVPSLANDINSLVTQVLLCQALHEVSHQEGNM